MSLKNLFPWTKNTTIDTKVYVEGNVNGGNVAGLYRVQGKYAEAEPFYLRSLEIFRKILGENNPNTVQVRENLENLQAAKK